MAEGINGKLNDENILHGGPQLPLLGGGKKSVGEIMFKLLQDNPSVKIVIESTPKVVLTSAEIHKQSVHLAYCLNSSGIRNGDVVSICSLNCAEYPVIVLASLYLGAIISPINPQLCETEISFMLNSLTKPKLIFTSCYSAKKVINSGYHCNIVLLPNLENIPHNDILHYNDFITKNYNNKDAFVCVPLEDPNATSLYLFTSGTAGIPKGIELSHRNFIATLTKQQLLWNTAIIASIMPWFHVYGFMTMLSAFITNSKYVSIPMYNEELFLQVIESHRANVVLVNPGIVNLLTYNPVIKKYNLSSIRVMYCASAPLKKESVYAIKESIGDFQMRQAYGMTELSLLSLCQNADHCTAGSIGALTPGVWGKISCLKTGASLGAYRKGEMCFKGDIIMKGYLNDKHKTDAVIDKDGWFQTNDIGYYDENNEWFCIDRANDVINFENYIISPVEIECFLIMHPDVTDAAVIGKSTKSSDELALGIVVKKSGSQVTKDDIINYMKDVAPYEKQLHGGIIFVDHIPRNQTGKILRRELREHLQSTTKNKTEQSINGI